MSFTCEFCNHKFTTQNTLQVHQKTAKYCLEKQTVSSSTRKTQCEFCLKNLATVQRLNTHTPICKNRFESLINKKTLEVSNLESQNSDLANRVKYLERENFLLKRRKSKSDAKIKSLTSQVSELTSKLCHTEGVVEGIIIAPAKTTNNNVTINQKLANLPVNHVRPLTEGTVSDVFENYSLEDLKNGLPRFIEYLNQLITHRVPADPNDETSQEIVELNFVCTDEPRNKFHRFPESRSWQRDPCGRYIHVILDTISPRVKELYRDLRKEAELNGMNSYESYLYDELKNMVVGITTRGSARDKFFKQVRSQIKQTSAV